MAVPSASGSGIVNKGTTYGASSQVTSTNINAHVDDAVFNANAVDGTTINADDNGKNLFVVDASISSAKLASSSVSGVKIVDGAVSAAKLSNASVTSAKIVDSNVTLAKIADIADNRVLGNVSGGSAAPSELTGANLVTMMGTSLMNPTSVDNSTSTVTLSNGIILKFGTHTTSGSSTTQTLNFSDHGGNFTNHLYSIQLICTTALSSSNSISINSQSASSVEFKAHRATNGDTYSFIAIGR